MTPGPGRCPVCWLFIHPRRPGWIKSQHRGDPGSRRHRVEARAVFRIVVADEVVLAEKYIRSRIEYLRA
jgi:hypothetical protein